MNGITFANPGYFYLFLIFIPLIGWYIYKVNSSNPTIKYSNISGLRSLSLNYLAYLRHLPFATRLIALSFLFVALARPQSMDKWEDVTTEGIDIIVSLDLSSSMLAQDFKPNRLEAAKDVAVQFISGRPYDRMGLVVFSRESFTQCPLTTDHAVLINLFKDLKTGLLEDGTAIGLGLSTAVKRLKDSEAKSKVVILLTDGINNSGDIDPATSAEIAKTFGVRVYTVGVGSEGLVDYPTTNIWGQKAISKVELPIDEKSLLKIAQITNGKYFRATNKAKLIEIYKEIDQLEKSKIDVQQHKKINEEYLFFVILALTFLILEFLLKFVILKIIP